ncbi:MAG: hypothetical protein GY794_02530 [bacterium]|nr:hypothetical protein [bacterium]
MTCKPIIISTLALGVTLATAFIASRTPVRGDEAVNAPAGRDTEEASTGGVTYGRQSKPREFTAFQREGAACLGQIRGIDASKIRGEKGRGARIDLELSEYDAMRFAALSRNPKAAEPLAKFIAVTCISIYGQTKMRPLMDNEADKTLEAIGLPGVDAILKRAAAGKLKPWQRARAHEIAIKILGNREGLGARAKFLKLDKVQDVAMFLKTEPTSRPSKEEPRKP